LIVHFQVELLIINENKKKKSQFKCQIVKTWKSHRPESEHFHQALWTCTSLLTSLSLLPCLRELIIPASIRNFDDLRLCKATTIGITWIIARIIINIFHVKSTFNFRLSHFILLLILRTQTWCSLYKKKNGALNGKTQGEWVWQEKARDWGLGAIFTHD
jgi:hypothetical protein